MAVGLQPEINVTRRHSRRVSSVVMWQRIPHGNIHEQTPVATGDSVAQSLDLCILCHNRGRHGVSGTHRIERRTYLLPCDRIFGSSGGFWHRGLRTRIGKPAQQRRVSRSGSCLTFEACDLIPRQRQAGA